MPLILVDVVDVDYQRLTLTVFNILGGGGGTGGRVFFPTKSKLSNCRFRLIVIFKEKELERFQFFTN